MSIVKIQSLMQSRYTSVSSGVVHAFTNMHLKPVAGTPFERVDFLHAPTLNPTYGEGLKREVIIMQVMLHYPPGAGAGAALARAEAIRAAFARGWTAIDAGPPQLRILIDRSPWLTEQPAIEGWFRVAVSIELLADVYGS